MKATLPETSRGGKTDVYILLRPGPSGIPRKQHRTTAQKMMPCPFCGGKHAFVNVVGLNPIIGDTYYGRAACETCSAELHVWECKTIEDATLSAIAAWNRRKSK